MTNASTNNNGNGASAIPTPTPASSQPATISWQGFRVPSQDQHGHSERIFFRVQPGHARQIQSIVQLSVWPYRDTGDLLRHALDRHLKFLDSLLPIPSVTKQVDAIMEVLREEEFNTDFRSLFDKLQQQVSVYVGMGSEREARSLVVRVKQYIVDMPQGDWKRRYESELEERFGHLITNARGVKLTDSDPNAMYVD